MSEHDLKLEQRIKYVCHELNIVREYFDNLPLKDRADLLRMAFVERKESSTFYTDLFGE